ncbi:MAG: phosphatidate cytidylyltransferase, partial [Acidobacteriota bacterium]
NGTARREVWLRLMVSPALLAAALGLLWWHHRLGSSVPTDLALALLAGAAACEVAAMLGRAGCSIPPALPVLTSAALGGLGLAFPADPDMRNAARLALLVFAVALAFVPHLRAPRHGDLERLVGTLFPIAYVGLLLGILRELGDGSGGARRLALVVIAAKASDIGGWLVGKTAGRHRMIPSVSPGKTWEGTVGGLAFSAAAAVGLEAALGPLPELATGPAQAAILGILLGAASIAAGLTNSVLKRRCGVKDSSSLVPGVGGVLDVVDSLLLAAPAAWLWMLFRG